MKDTVTFIGTLDPWKAFEALGRIIGDKYGVEVKLKSLRDKETGEIILKNHEDTRKGSH